MTQIKYTSAGRLLVEVHRIKRSYDQGNSVSRCLINLFSGNDTHWSYGLKSFSNLSNRVYSDIYLLEENRRSKFEKALANIDQSVSPDIFHRPANEISARFFDDLTIERLESVDDLLRQAGHSVSVDQEKASIVSDELDALIKDIEEGDSSEIDDFLKSKLSELRFVLDHYTLFGSEGVKDAIGTILGTLTIESIACGGFSDGALKNAKAVWRVAKGALDALVYTQSGADAIEWAGHGLGLLEG